MLSILLPFLNKSKNSCLSLQKKIAFAIFFNNVILTLDYTTELKDKK